MRVTIFNFLYPKRKRTRAPNIRWATAFGTALYNLIGFNHKGFMNGAGQNLFNKPFSPIIPFLEPQGKEGRQRKLPSGNRLRVVITVDVEEEGLFSGRYEPGPAEVNNVRQLHRLEFISREFGLPLTLLPTYPVVRNPVCRDILAHWRDEYHAEIGAHLHPWNTPPFQDIPFAEPVPSDRLPLFLLRAKFETLLSALKDHMEIQPRAFRMGRFDLGEQVLTLLSEYGFRVDSSVVPLRCVPGGPDHFLAPNEPYLLQTDAGPGFGPLLEVPLTQVGVFPAISSPFYRIACALSRSKRDFFFFAYRNLAVVGIHPAWFPLVSMKQATRLHRLAGGRVLTMFLHSSELQPGATPSFKSKADVDGLIARIRAYLTWLLGTQPVRGETLSGLYDARTKC
jgi:hypothetical protein